MSMITIKKSEPERLQVGELSHLDFRKPQGELGCFLNYEPKILREPTEAQRRCLQEDGVVLPEGVTDVDASTMICRVGAWDVQPGPDPEAVAMAERLGTKYSAFIGAEDLLRLMVEQADDQARAALYCYGVACAVRGGSFGNMFDDPSLPLFISFADVVAADPSLRKSLAERHPDDYKKPKKSSKVCKAAVAHLAGGGIV